MKFSKDTTRLVEGRWYWVVVKSGPTPTRVLWCGASDSRTEWLWGDECPPPTVEVEPERPPESALLPCPFCGSTDVALSSSDGHPDWSQWVLCAACRAEGPPASTDGRAIAAWNTRVAPAAAPAPAEPSPPAWVPPVCPAGQMYVDDGGIVIYAWAAIEMGTRRRFPPPAWPPRIGEIVEVLIATTANREQWVQHAVTSGVWRYADSNEYVRCGDRVISRAGEGTKWRWVYRDLSGYVPPGGGQ